VSTPASPPAVPRLHRVAQPARAGALRAHNLALALRVVAEATQPVSRADVAAASGLTRATVSTLVDALVAGSLVREVVLPPTARSGRPATGLVVAAGAAGGIGGLGVEINVDYVATTVVDLAGQVVVRDVIVADQRLHPPLAVVRGAGRAAARAVGAATEQGITVTAVALAVPGLVDAATGRLLLAPNLGWRDVDVVGLLRREPALAELSVTVDNEASFAALGELSVTHGPRDFIHVSGDVGIGAGVVLGGLLYRGSRGWAGEIGHVTIDPNGPPCTCGSRGCLEQYAGQEAILRRAGIDGAAATVLGGQPTVQRIADLAIGGDGAVLLALAEAGRALGVAVAAIVNVLDVDTVLLGGAYGLLAPWLQPQLEEELTVRVVWAHWSPLTVRTATAGADAAVVGAARSVVDGVLTDPSSWLAR
jgi:predicted NBD/HSP70 family sugar kinase